MEKEFIKPLIKWYQKNRRILPWREESTPYRVWISEIMLQQTRVEAVKEYFNRFMKEIPNIDILAQIEDEKLLKLWEGLGYYNRARNLKKAAIMIKEKYKTLPDNYETLLTLPGIGDYTAGAIASISFKELVPAVDGNVLRVITRLTGSYEDITLEITKKNIRQDLLSILPKEVDLFNQALMELGAMICLPNGNPLCQKCPIKGYCVANKNNLTSILPIKTKKQARRIEERIVLIITDQSKFVLRKREEKGLLASMYEFPNYIGKGNNKEILTYLKNEHVIKIEELDSSKHIFSHVEWHMKNFLITLDMIPKEDNYLWVTWEELKNRYPLPTAFSKTKELLETKIKDIV